MRSQKQEKVTWSVKSGCLGIGHCAPNSTNYPSHPSQVNERQELNAEQPSSKRGGGGMLEGQLHISDGQKVRTVSNERFQTPIPLPRSCHLHP